MGTGCDPRPPDQEALVQEIVATAGGTSQAFWTYDIDADSWSVLPSVPGAVGPGGAIAQLQRLGTIYVLRGGSTTDFYRYREPGGWTQLAATPGPVGPGGALVGLNSGTQSQRDRLFALQGNGSTAVWDYDVASDSWTVLAQAPESVQAGGGIASLNYGLEGTLDLFVGGGVATVHRLDMSSRTWMTVGAAPGPVLAGGAISHQFDGCDFGVTGGGTTHFFSIGGLPACSAQGALAGTPAPVMAGAAVATAPGDSNPSTRDDYVFATRGGGTRDFWRYSISANAWVAMSPTPGPVSEGGATVQVPGRSP